MQARKRVLILNPPQDKSGEAILESEVEIVRLSNPDRDTLLRSIKGVHGLIAGGTKVTADVLAQADLLEVEVAQAIVGLRRRVEDLVPQPRVQGHAAVDLEVVLDERGLLQDLEMRLFEQEAA